MKVNFSEVEDKDYEPLPPSMYVVNVTDGEMRESGPNSKNPGASMIHWEFTVAEGDFEGRKVWSNTMCEGKGLFSLKQLLSATGKFDVDADLDFEIDDVLGSQVKIRVTQREYNGDTVNDVKKFLAVGDQSGDSSLLP